MTTRLISVKQLAQNLSKVLREAQENNIHYVVMRHGVPIADVLPKQLKQEITEEDLIAEGIDVEQLKKDVAEAREQIKRGEVYSTEEVRAMLDI